MVASKSTRARTAQPEQPDTTPATPEAAQALALSHVSKALEILSDAIAKQDGSDAPDVEDDLQFRLGGIADARLRELSHDLTVPLSDDCAGICTELAYSVTALLDGAVRMLPDTPIGLCARSIASCMDKVAAALDRRDWPDAVEEQVAEREAGQPKSSQPPMPPDLLNYYSREKTRLVLSTIASNAQTLNEVLIVALDEPRNNLQASLLAGAMVMADAIGALADQTIGCAAYGDLAYRMCGPVFGEA